MATTRTTSSIPTASVTRARGLRAWLLWTAGFLAFPIAGVAGIAVAGRVNGLLPALLGGLVTGAVLGLGQAMVSSGRLPKIRWTAATALGMGAGLVLGAHTVGYGTTMGELAGMGALTGAVLGAAQAVVLPKRTRARWVWALAMPVLWATGWVVTTAAGIAVEEQFTLFGASGAITVTALLGVLLHTLLPLAGSTPSDVTNATPTSHTITNGDPS
jgi:hypothetical protein